MILLNEMGVEMRKVLGISFFFVGLLMFATSGTAEISIKAFAGVWEGNAVSRSATSVTFPITSRDLDVEIRPSSDGGFSIVWRTLQRQKGSPNAPETVEKETTRIYMPSRDGKIWTAKNMDYPFDGGTVSWAALEGQALVVYSMAVRADGGYDMLIYRRILTGLNMKLEFKALRNGEVRRTASGTLVKAGN